MNQPHHKLEVLSWIAGIAVAVLTFYVALRPSPEVLTQEQTILPIVSPSFDCPRASNNVERLICSTPDIAILDLTMANAYRDLFAERRTKEQRNELKTSQNYWLSHVRGKCLNTTCLKEVYDNRIIQLRNARR